MRGLRAPRTCARAPVEPAASVACATVTSAGCELLLALLGGVLVLASLNVAALLLSRSEARRDEIAIRLALGAGRAACLRQLLTESAVIAAGGGALGLLIAWRGSELLLRLAMPNTTVLPIDLSPDLRIVAFTCVVSIAGCLVFGLLPAVRATASPRRVREVRSAAAAGAGSIACW